MLIVRLWIIALIFILSVFTEDIPDEYISSKEAIRLRENGETVVIAFSTQHCPHCQRLGNKLPEYRDMFNSLELNAKIHKMDIHDESNKDFVGQFDINGVPTVYVFVGNQTGIKYEGNREASDLASFVSKLQNLKVHMLTDEMNVNDFKSEYPALIAVVPDLDTKIEVVEAASIENIGVNFAYLTSELAKEIGLSEGIHLFREDGNLTLEEVPADISALNEWIKVAVLQAISPFPSAAKNIFSSGVHDILFLIDNKDGITSESWAHKLAESLRGRMVVASIDRKDEKSSHALDFFSADAASEEPIVRIFNNEKRKQYWLDKEVNGETLVAWIDQYLNGQVNPHMNSEVLDDGWNAKPLAVLAGSNFNEVVFDKEKDVFVFFHAPWCGHCKKLAPLWEELAESYADKSKIVIAKLDATANDVDDGHGDIQGFPTLRLYKSGDNSMHEYNGERSVEDFQKFIEEQTGFAASNDAVKSDDQDHDEL